MLHRHTVLPGSNNSAIHINPYTLEVWFDLGILYESYNNQIGNAIDAYERAAELDQSDTHIVERLTILKTAAQQTGGALPGAPVPKDVHPIEYASGCAHAPHRTEGKVNTRNSAYPTASARAPDWRFL